MFLIKLIKVPRSNLEEHYRPTSKILVLHDTIVSLPTCRSQQNEGMTYNIDFRDFFLGGGGWSGVFWKICVNQQSSFRPVVPVSNSYLFT